LIENLNDARFTPIDVEIFEGGGCAVLLGPFPAAAAEQFSFGSRQPDHRAVSYSIEHIKVFVNVVLTGKSKYRFV